MNKKISVGVALAFLFLFTALTVTLTMIASMRLFDQKVLNVKERAAMYSKISELDSIVRQNTYFKINEKSLYDSMAKGYISGLNDPDTEYLTQEQVASRAAKARGTVISPGFEYARDANNYVIITKIYENTPAQQQDLRIEDVVIKIDGEDVINLTSQDIDTMLSGVLGSKFSLTYTRDGKEHEVELMRVSVNEISVFYNEGIEGIGYIKIKSVNEKTYSQFESAVESVRKNTKIKGLILDLRNTDGGTNIASIAAMADIMVPTGTMISGSYPDGTTTTLYTSDSRSFGIPAVILVNENTKGFSELFCGVLRDLNDSKVVGVKTFGKGTLQQLTVLSDGSAVNLTIAKLLTPKGELFDKEGITPDYVVESKEDFIIPDEEPNIVQDKQLNRAVEVLSSLIGSFS